MGLGLLHSPHFQKLQEKKKKKQVSGGNLESKRVLLNDAALQSSWQGARLFSSLSSFLFLCTDTHTHTHLKLSLIWLHSLGEAEEGRGRRKCWEIRGRSPFLCFSLSLFLSSLSLPLPFPLSLSVSPQLDRAKGVAAQRALAPPAASCAATRTQSGKTLGPGAAAAVLSPPCPGWRPG